MRVFGEVEKLSKQIQSETNRDTRREDRACTGTIAHSTSKYANRTSSSGGDLMRNLVTAILCLSLTGLGGCTKPRAALHRPSSQGAAAAPQEPTAIIETTDGNITCTLFPDKAPLTVANFIGLANGTKAWKNPKTGQMMHTPLYDGTICHRVIPNFMIQCGDPAGNGTGRSRLQLQGRVQPRPYLRPARPPGDGELRAEHQRFAVLHHRSSNAAPERQAHHLRPVRGP